MVRHHVAIDHFHIAVIFVIVRQRLEKGLGLGRGDGKKDAGTGFYCLTQGIAGIRPLAFFHENSGTVDSDRERTQFVN